MHPAVCMGNLLHYLQVELDGNLESLLQGYDWLVMDFGIWEITRNWICRHGRNDTTLDRVTLVLDMLAMMAATTTHSSFQVIWLTTGTAQGMDPQLRHNLDAMNNVVRNWFATQTSFSSSSPQQSNNNMHLVDWAKQMEPRSDGANRISGDLKPHWGLQARLLLAQMVTHLVVTIEGHML